MDVARPLRLTAAVVLSAAVALAAMYSVRLVAVPADSFIPGSFVTHTVMLVLSLCLIGTMSRGRPGVYGLTRGTYRFRPTILLWGIPTAALSILAMLASRGRDVEAAAGDLTKLQQVVFIWIYASMSEEVLTRGLLQTMLTRGWGAGSGKHWLSLPSALSGLFFGAMHIVLIRSMGPAAVPVIVMATLLGFVAARYRESTGSLIPAVVVHALFNVGGMLPVWVMQWARG